jgi:EAL domain-containing protein (putative c-di-GMP-specific phosphodiesterase class I)
MNKFIKAIKPLGIRTALEIGNMPASFHHLKKMDVDFFKLPANLVRELATKEDSQELLQELTKELLALEKPVIAAGVKDANTMALLWEYGADYVQGSYVHKPTETMNFDFRGGG